MQDTLIAIIGLMLAVILLFVFPLMEIAGKGDELSETVVQLATSDFVNHVSQQGKITIDEYSALVQRVYATGNSYDIEIEVKILDDNPSRVTTSGTSTLSGEKKYYSVYTNTIIEKLQESEVYLLKADDYITVRVKNNNVTMGTTLRNYLYRLIGQDVSIIETTASALVLEQGRLPEIEL